MIEKENPVQMIDLMLYRAGLVAGRLSPKGPAVAVERIDHDASGPFHVAEDLGDRETAFLRRLMLLAALHDDGIDERKRGWIVVADVHDRDTSRHADLVRGEPDSFGGAHRLEQIVYQPAHLVVHRGDAGGLLSQHR